MLWNKSNKYSDAEIIIGLQNHDSIVEKCFFEMMQKYFNLHFNEFFFDPDSKQEIFQKTIIKLWTEIENKTIRIIDNAICRRQRTGVYNEMTATLSTFMMAFAKNEFRELLRSRKDDNLEEIVNSSPETIELIDESPEEETHVIQVIDDCILSMSPNCIEIITMF